MTRRGRRRAAPTHHELLAVKDRLEVARKGEHVLERRRDSLVFVLLDLLDRWEALHERVEEQFEAASRVHVWGAEREGEIALRELSEARTNCPELLVTETKLLGLRVPVVLSAYVTTAFEDRGYGLLGSSALDDAIAEGYETLLETVIRIAELKGVLLRLLAEIRRLRIRVNYLQFEAIPELEAERRYIERYLAEREQEERYRQFRVKKRREETRESKRGAPRDAAETGAAESRAADPGDADDG